VSAVHVLALARPSGTSAAFLAAIATRTLVVGVTVIVGLRLFGRRQLGQTTIYDLATVMALANAVQNAITRGSGYLVAGVVSAGTLLLLAGALSALFVRFPVAERGLVGSPTLLAFEGEVMNQALRHAGVTKAEVMAAVREHGLEGLADVLTATLEVDGSISVVARTSPRRRHHRALAPPGRRSATGHAPPPGL